MGGGTPERAGKLSWASSQDAGAGEKSSEASGSQGLCLCTSAGVHFLVVFILFYFFVALQKSFVTAGEQGRELAESVMHLFGILKRSQFQSLFLWVWYISFAEGDFCSSLSAC